MILSASRRTDIPAFYSEWFFNRLKEGFVYFRNPFNFRQISKVSLSPSVVDGIVFWTKNPNPMMERLDELKNYPYYFQFTITPYENDVEKNIPNKLTKIIPTFQKLSNRIGADRVIWRYDPIFLSPKYNLKYHLQSFEFLAKQLSNYTHKCVISFLDLYENIITNIKRINGRPPTTNDMNKIASAFSSIAEKYHLSLESCAENIDLDKYNIKHGHCIDTSIFENILHCKLDLTKDPYQRQACGCASSIDIGMYDTCLHNCIYCYANSHNCSYANTTNPHNPNSPLLVGNITPEDIIKERKVISYKNYQQNLLY